MTKLQNDLQLADNLKYYELKIRNNFLLSDERYEALYEELLKSIVDGRVKTFKEAVDLYCNNYRIYTNHYNQEFTDTPNLWLKIDKDKTFFKQKKREEKLREIKNKSVFDE